MSEPFPIAKAIQEDDEETVLAAIGGLPSEKLQSLLSLAAYLGKPIFVRHLLDAGAAPDELSKKGMTPLHRAVSSNSPPDRQGSEEVARMLLAAGADPTRALTRDSGWQGWKRWNGLTLTAQNRSATLLKELLEVPKARSQKLLDATLVAAIGAFEETREKVELLLELGANPSTKWALADACSSPSRSSVALLLLEHGADATQLDKRQCGPLHFACEASIPSLVESLLAKGADPEVATNRRVQDTEIRKGDTPKALASRQVDWWGRMLVEQMVYAATTKSVGDVEALGVTDVDSAWKAAVRYAESQNDETMRERLEDPAFREKFLERNPPPTAKFEQANRVLEILGLRNETRAFGAGTWTLVDVEHSENGRPSDLDRWLGGRDRPTLELRSDGTFEGTLRRRSLHGTWSDSDRIALIDDELGDLGASFQGELSIAEVFDGGEQHILYFFERAD